MDQGIKASRRLAEEATEALCGNDARAATEMGRNGTRGQGKGVANSEAEERMAIGENKGDTRAEFVVAACAGGRDLAEKEVGSEGRRPRGEGGEAVDLRLGEFGRLSVVGASGGDEGGRSGGGDGGRVGGGRVRT